MKMLAVIPVLLSLAFAQAGAPAAGSTVRWDASAPGASRELPDGRTQKTVRSTSAEVSAIADVTWARQFVDPPSEGGNEVAYVLLGIQNASTHPAHFDPRAITLRIVGKKENELKRLREDQVIGRAWAGNVGGQTISGVKDMRGDNDVGLEAAVTARRTDTSNRTLQQASEQNTVAQTAKLKEKTVPARDLEPGESITGMVFFYPYSSKDAVELTIPLGDTTFVIPFSGGKKKH